MEGNSFKKSFKDNYEIVIENGVQIGGSLIDGVIGHVLPGVVAFRSSWKIKQMEKRINTLLQGYEQRILTFESLYANLRVEMSDFIFNQIIPLIFDQASEETQEEKIQLLLNGLESCMAEEAAGESVSITYFDVLDKLRYEDILYLLDFAHLIDPHIVLFQFEKEESYFEIQGYKEYLLNKLLSNGLIEIREPISNPFGQSNGAPSYMSDIKDYKISSFGDHFIKFFRSKDHASFK